MSYEEPLDDSYQERRSWTRGQYGARDAGPPMYLVADELHRIGDLLEMLVAAQQESYIKTMVAEEEPTS